MTQTDLFKTHADGIIPARSAVFCPNECHRYLLTRTWDSGYGTMLFVMLNPSTADANMDDPTIRRCMGFARREHFGGIEVVNLYAYRATDPRELNRASNVVGRENDQYILEAVERAGMVVAAWGGNVGPHSARVDAVRAILCDEVWAFGFTKSKRPRHPLMLAKNTPLERLK